MNWLNQVLQSMSKPLQWWVVVAPWEQAIRVRLGSRTAALPPGIHFRIPFLDRVIRLCVRERVVNCDNRTIATSDMKAVTLGLSLRYSISDARKMLEELARPEETIKAMAQALASEYVSRTSSEALSPQAISEHVAKQINDVDLCDKGFKNIEVFVVTLAYARVIRILQAYDHSYGSAFDQALDDKPATVN